jgi:phage tail-like protein
MLIEKQLHTMLTAGFRFVVAVDYRPLGAFTECTLPTIEWEVEALKEGGQNRYVRQLRGPRKQTNVTLQNGIGLMSDIMLWYLRTMQEDFSKREVTITILSAMFLPTMVWHIEDAFPVRWSLPQLQTGGNTVAMQTLELACGEITVV